MTLKELVPCFQIGISVNSLAFPEATIAGLCVNTLLASSTIGVLDLKFAESCLSRRAPIRVANISARSGLAPAKLKID
jgi:hypothetical protein